MKAAFWLAKWKLPSDWLNESCLLIGWMKAAFWLAGKYNSLRFQIWVILRFTSLWSLWCIIYIILSYFIIYIYYKYYIIYIVYYIYYKYYIIYIIIYYVMYILCYLYNIIYYIMWCRVMHQVIGSSALWLAHVLLMSSLWDTHHWWWCHHYGTLITGDDVITMGHSSLVMMSSLWDTHHRIHFTIYK